MYKQKYFDIVNYVLLYSSYLANKMHTERIHAQYNLFHLEFCCCLCSCMVDCCIWLFFCIFCTYIIPAFFVERSLLLGYNSFDIAFTYPYDTTLLITHCCLISKEIYNTILCILLYNSYTLSNIMSMIPIHTKPNSIFREIPSNNTKVDCCILSWRYDV